jgi:acyl-CoA thioesterase
MSEIEKAEKIVKNLMFEKDSFSQWLGVEILEVKPGFCKIQCTINSDMLNGFLICHGGVTFSIADSAFAFASNSRGIHAVSIETSISHTKAVYPGDIITATAEERNLSSRFGVYEVSLVNQKNEIVGLFKGTVFRNGNEWEV